MTFDDRDAHGVLIALWSLLHQPVDTVRAATALIGMSPAAARLTANVVVATSPEADRLLDGMPQMIRSLAIATASRMKRCYGEVRGPIVWAETLAARAASAGDPQLYVCATADRAYDTGENRVLVDALRTIADAARAIERQGLARRSSELAKHVRYNGNLAVRFSEHRSLSTISRTPDRRDIRRARAGMRHRTYEPALAVLRTAAQAIGPLHLAALADDRTRAQHALLLDTLRGLERRGAPVVALRAAPTSITGGQVTYVHPGSAVRSNATPGVHVGPVVLDVPGRAPDAAGDDKRVVIIESPADLDRELDALV